MESKKKLLVIIHGLSADGHEWWGSTKETFRDSPILFDVESIFFHYDTSKVAHIATNTTNKVGIGDKRASVPDVGKRLWSNLQLETAKHDYSEIYLLGHSMGGIVIAAAIAHAFESPDDRNPDLINAIKKVALVASPISGAELASHSFSFLFNIFGPSDHLKILEPDDKTRERIVLSFMKDFLKGKKVPLHLFQAEKDSVVNPDELKKVVPSEIAYRFDVLTGGHSTCVQDLSQRHENFEKLLMWVKPFKVDTGQVSPDDESDSLAHLLGPPLPGTDGQFNIGGNPKGWSATMMTGLEYDKFAYGAELQEEGDVYRDVMVFTSDTKRSIIPTPFVSKISGREFPSALELPVGSEFVIALFPKARPPLFTQQSIDENIAILTGSIAVTGLMKLVSQDSGVLKKSGKQFRKAEFIQEAKKVILDGVPGQNITIRTQIYLVEGDFHDYSLRMRIIELDGQHGNEEELLAMQALFNSFTLLDMVDGPKQVGRDESKRQDLFNEHIRSNGVIKYNNEWSVFLEQILHFDLDKPEIQEKLLTKIRPFKEFAARFEELKEDAIKFDTMVSEAENDNPKPMVEFIKLALQIREQQIEAAMLAGNVEG